MLKFSAYCSALQRVSLNSNTMTFLMTWNVVFRVFLIWEVLLVLRKMRVAKFYSTWNDAAKIPIEFSQDWGQTVRSGLKQWSFKQLLLMKVFANTLSWSIWFCILQIVAIEIRNLLSKEKEWDVSHLTGRYIQTSTVFFASHASHALISIRVTVFQKDDPIFSLQTLLAHPLSLEMPSFINFYDFFHSQR